MQGLSAERGQPETLRRPSCRAVKLRPLNEYGLERRPRLGEMTAWEGAYRMAYYLSREGEDGRGVEGAAYVCRAMGSNAEVGRLARPVMRRKVPRIWLAQSRRRCINFGRPASWATDCGVGFNECPPLRLIARWLVRRLLGANLTRYLLTGTG